MPAVPFIPLPSSYARLGNVPWIAVKGRRKAANDRATGGSTRADSDGDDGA